jgi:hypothetical protein
MLYRPPPESIRARRGGGDARPTLRLPLSVVYLAVGNCIVLASGHRSEPRSSSRPRRNVTPEAGLRQEALAMKRWLGRRWRNTLLNGPQRRHFSKAPRGLEGGLSFLCNRLTFHCNTQHGRPNAVTRNSHKVYYGIFYLQLDQLLTRMC